MPITAHGAMYGPDDPLIEFILGITYEIWEQRGIERIFDYYGKDAPIYALSGVSRGAQAVVDGTRAMLASFPDRILVGDDVIWCGSREEGFYSSHRIVSTMTNRGASLFGPPTDRQARVLTIADCEIRDGVIVREWLMRDMASLARQLGIDLITAAAALRATLSDDTRRWIDSELQRHASDTASDQPGHAMAHRVLDALWLSGDQSVIDQHYAPYAALHAAADDLHSGRDALAAHYNSLRGAISVESLIVDHVAALPGTDNADTMAVRWTASGRHTGTYLGAPATSRQILILGATHWRFFGGRIIAEWTVFDQLGVLAQMLDEA